MGKVQKRRSVSLRPEIYAQLAARAQLEQVPIAAAAERAVQVYLHQAPAPATSRIVRRPR